MRFGLPLASVLTSLAMRAILYRLLTRLTFGLLLEPRLGLQQSVNERDKVGFIEAEVHNLVLDNEVLLLLVVPDGRDDPLCPCQAPVKPA